MSTILGIESTCDETAAAVVVDGHDVRSNVVATQFELHAKYRGVVPEIACRAHIENILPVLREATAGAGVGQTFLSVASVGRAGMPETDKNVCPTDAFNVMDAIAVAHRPGLIGSLLIGVDHVHAHLYSVVLETNEHPPMPAVGLVVSGGHTALYRVNSWLDVTLIGSTIDDAVGEAYDKVAGILGLGYPGGPILDRLAEQGDPKAVRFPRTLLGRESLDFSFSGLKTAVLYHVRGVPRKDGPDVRSAASHPPPTGQALNDIAASFQAACVDVIETKLRRAVGQTGARSVIIGGGVSANDGLRAALTKLPVPVFFPPLRYCTDNAAMSAGLADLYFREGRFSSLGLDAMTYSQFRV